VGFTQSLLDDRLQLQVLHELLRVQKSIVEFKFKACVTALFVSNTYLQQWRNADVPMVTITLISYRYSCFLPDPTFNVAAAKSVQLAAMFPQLLGIESNFIFSRCLRTSGSCNWRKHAKLGFQNKSELCRYVRN